MDPSTLETYVSPRMGERSRKAIYLHFVKGFTPTEASKQAGFTIQAGTQAINRIKRKLEADGYRQVIDYRKS